jgi:glycolate oxidase FAD binding subunit
MSLVAPVEEAEIAGVVRAAHDEGAPLLIEGNGTKSCLMRPVQAARTLSLSRHCGITLYSPKELVLSALAGTRMADIEAALAEEGQYMIAEPPDFSALLGIAGGQTIGGVVAANLSGPRRVAWGAMRDHVLGVRAVNGSGEVIRSGGRVLKNVTGLDLCKLLTGSYGTLAVLTEITVKVLPRPAATASLALEGLNAEESVAAMSRALGSPYGVSGAAWLPALAGFAGSVTLIRIEDFATSTAYRIGRLQAELGGAILAEADSRAAWITVRDAEALGAAPDDAVWRVSVRPSAGPAVVAALEGAKFLLDWGGGLVWVAGPADESMHRRVAKAAAASGGTWTLFRAPEPLRTSLDVIPREAIELAKITRRVKAAFDPKGIFNPGRLYAGL